MGLEQRQVPCPRNVDEAQNNRDREHSLSSGSVGLGMPRDAPDPLQAGRRTLSERRRFVMPGAWRMHSPGVRYRAKRGIRYPDDPCGPSLRGESGKNTDAPEKRKKPPEGGFVYPVKRAP